MPNAAQLDSGPRLLRTRAAAQYLSLSAWKLQALIQAGELPVIKYGENAPHLLDRNDLDAWIERHKQIL